MRRFLWEDLFDVCGAFERGTALVWGIAAMVLVFFGALVIDQLRIRFVERPFFRWLYGRSWMKKIEEKTDGLWKTVEK